MLFFASLVAGFWLASALAATAVIYGAVLPEEKTAKRPRVRPEEIIDPDFTGGLRSEEYLARLREGGV